MSVGLGAIRLRWLTLLVLGGMGLLLVVPSHPARAHLSEPSIRLIESNAERVVVEFRLPDYVLRDMQAEQQTYTQATIPGMSLSTDPGRPQLPQTGTLIGLPPEGSATVRVLDADQEVVSVIHPIYPAPRPVPLRTDGKGHPLGSLEPAYAFELDQQIYGSDTFYPNQVATVKELGQVGGQRIARLTIAPLRFHPLRRELEVTRRLLLEVRFDAPQETGTVASTAQASPVDRLLRTALLNGEAASTWSKPASFSQTTAVLQSPATQPNSTKVIVDSTGIHTLTYGDLAELIPVDTLDPTTLQLFEGENEIAIRVTGEQDGSFDSGDMILFYGRVPRSRYTDRNTYWLRYGDTAGLRMASRDATPGSEPLGTAWTTARYDLNQFYDPHYPAADGDHWYAADLRPYTGYDHTAQVVLNPLDTYVPTATLRIGMVGWTEGSYHTVFTVNGISVGDLAWSGHNPVTATFELARSLLQDGSNTVHTTETYTNAATWLDTIEIDYALRAASNERATFWGQPGLHRYALYGFPSNSVSVYDIVDPQHPVLLTNVTGGGVDPIRFADSPTQTITYHATSDSQIRQPVALFADTPSNLVSTANGADYLIIAHADLLSAIQPLVAYHQGQGLRVSVVDVQDVYDEFGGGDLHPEAIRSFVAYAYDNWTLPRLHYVLLVGDGHYDFLDHFGYGRPNLIPPYLAMVDEWWGETAADNRYTDIEGEDLVDLPIIGRLPVESAAEAETVVDKIISYQETPWLGEWNATHIFATDDTDDAGDFDDSAESIYSTYIHAPWVGERIYLDDLSEAEARQRTLDAWQQGSLLTTFIGHSSWHQWTEEVTFHLSDVPSLQNGQRWPTLLSMTCFTGFFHHPEYGTLDESLLRLDTGGAVATWSPSGLGVQTGHDELLNGFYDAVFTDGETLIGEAILSAKLDLLAKAPEHSDLVETYHLFGDPAMALNLTIRPWPHGINLPLVMRNYTGDSQ